MCVRGHARCERRAEVDWRLEEQPYYPPLVNDGGTQRFAARVAAQLLGAAKVTETEALMTGEVMI